jgi:hypothetical protein
VEICYSLLKLGISLGSAGWHVPSLILILAALGTVLRSLACAFNLQDLSTCAEFTLSNIDPLVFDELESKFLQRLIFYLCYYVRIFKSVIFQGL